MRLTPCPICSDNVRPRDLCEHVYYYHNLPQIAQCGDVFKIEFLKYVGKELYK